MLRVPGSYSRGRSPSPGGKHRHRSHSRKHSPSRERSKSRSKTSSSKHHYDSDSMDDRPRAPASRSSTKKRYDLDLSDDDRYKSDYKSDYKNDYKSDRGRRAPRDRHYLSDEESVAGPRQSNTSLRSDRSDRYSHDTGAERSQRSTSRALRPLAKTQYYSDLYSDSEDEGLAYGDIYSDYPVSSGERRSRSRERVRKPKKFYDSDSSDEIQEPAPRTKDPPPKYRPHDSKSSKLGRSHSQKYYSAATNALAAKLQEAKSYFAEKPQNTGSGINEDEWAEIPECERPDFVPPDRRNQGYTASTSMNNQPGAPPPPPAPLPPATSQMPNSNYAYSQPHPPITPNKAGEPVRVPQYPTIPAPQYVPPEHYANLNKSAQPTQSFANPPTQFVSPEHYLNMNKKTQSPHTLTAPTPPRSAGHQRAYSTGNVPTTTPQQYAAPSQVQYTQVDPNVKYLPKSSKPAPPAPSTPTTALDKSQTGKQQNQAGGTRYMEITPTGGRPSGARPHSLSLSTDADLIKMPGGFPDGSRPPASPLLEPYHGTYQSISPMPWPTHFSDMDDFSDFDLDDGALSSSERAKSRKAKVQKTKSREALYRQKVSMESILPSNHALRYDPREDAKALKSALAHHKIDPKPLVEILPYLTAEEVHILRAEYKNIVKMTGHGVNLAKHIAFRVPGNFGKACHATALGQWESEAYWANFWYRSNSSRRELLIEALMGRPNAEVHQIKNCFKDKRYSDSLEKCMKAELKADKFRAAILLALEEKRQPDIAPIHVELVRRDVQDLHRALIAREGGESAMIQIIVVRGNAHLCEVMRLYENIYKQNFARAMIAKSQNLVGETLIHILNGALNRPMRDALLLHHAIAESGTGRDRAELLISRLIRMHWEPHHLERVNAEYKRRYGKFVEEHIVGEIINHNGAGKCDWAEFCIALVKSSRIHIMEQE